jgi:hypothetical protein
MGKFFLILIAALALVMLVSIFLAAVHFLFVLALIAVLLIVGLRLSRGARRRFRR